MTYNKKVEILEKMVKEFSLVHSKQKRREVMKWYDFASGIKDIETTRKIMKELEAI